MSIFRSIQDSHGQAAFASRATTQAVHATLLPEVLERSGTHDAAKLIPNCSFVVARFRDLPPGLCSISVRYWKSLILPCACYSWCV